MEEEKGCKVCMRCGKIMAAGAFFCNSCGADLRAEPRPGIGGAVDPQGFRSSRTWAPAPDSAAVPAAYVVPPPAFPPGVPTGVPTYASPAMHGAYLQQAAGYWPRKTDDLAVVAIACAVASFVILPFFAAVAAIATGYASRERIRKSAGTLTGDGLALAGILVGVANLVLILAIVLLALMAMLSS